MATHEPEKLKLPEIALSDLPESTKDFLIAYAASGKTITEAIREILDRAAINAGFQTENSQQARPA
jgi:hypothetical protein